MNKTDLTRIGLAGKEIRDNVERVIVGKGSVVELLLVAVFCEGHVLLEDVPGIGKTMLARSMARSLECTFRRIQCTPDLPAPFGYHRHPHLQSEGGCIRVQGRARLCPGRTRRRDQPGHTPLPIGPS